MATAQAKAVHETIVPDVNNTATVLQLIDFGTQLFSVLQANQSLSTLENLRHYKKTMKIVASIVEVFQQHLVELQAPTNADYSFPGLQHKHWFFPIYIQQLLVGAESFLLFRFYKRLDEDQPFSKKFTLASSNPLGEKNSSYHLMSEVMKALQLGIICCDRDTGGNPFGRMWSVRKDNITTANSKALGDNVTAKAMKVISKMDILCPEMVQQRLQKADSAMQLTTMCMEPKTFDVIHISGIPIPVYENKSKLDVLLLPTGGVLDQLFIKHPHIYQHKEKMDGHQMVSLDIRHDPYYYMAASKSVAIKLHESFKHHIAMRLLQVTVDNQVIQIVCTFMTKAQFDILSRGSEVLSLRPVPFEHISQIAIQVLDHYQPKTHTLLVIVALAMRSKWLTQENKTISRDEIALSVYTIENGDNTTTIRQRLQLPKRCSKDSTIVLQGTFRLQLALESKHFSYLAPPKITTGDNTMKYCTVHNVGVNVNPLVLLTEIQKNATNGHAIKYIYYIPTKYAMKLIIAFVVETLHHVDILQNIRTSLEVLHWFHDTETSLEVSPYHPGAKQYNLPLLKNINHPTMLSSRSSAPPKTTQSSLNKSNSNATRNSSSSSSSVQRETIANYFKSQSLPDTSGATTSAMQE